MILNRKQKSAYLASIYSLLEKYWVVAFRFFLVVALHDELITGHCALCGIMQDRLLSSRLPELYIMGHFGANSNRHY